MEFEKEKTVKFDDLEIGDKVIYHGSYGPAEGIIGYKNTSYVYVYHGNERYNGSRPIVLKEVKQPEDYGWSFSYALSPASVEGCIKVIKKGIKPIKREGGVMMLKVITDNYEKTSDAVVVEKYMGAEMEKLDTFVGSLIVKQFKNQILTEALVREEAEDEK